MNHILVVDDEAEIRSSLEEILREEGYGVAGAADADEAMVLLRDTPYDVVLLDIWLPGRDGLDLLAELRDFSPEMRPEVVIISGHGTIEAAVKATKLGAYDSATSTESEEGRVHRQVSHCWDFLRGFISGGSCVREGRRYCQGGPGTLHRRGHEAAERD